LDVLSPTSGWDNIGFIGPYAYLAGSDGLHLARFDDQGEVQDLVLGSGKVARACASDFSYTPQHKLAFVQGDGEALVFVDLDANPAAIRASVQPSQAGFKLSCPVWGDNDTALAFTESDGTNTTLAGPKAGARSRRGCVRVSSLMLTST
jgi:hypothetical protein